MFWTFKRSGVPVLVDCYVLLVDGLVLNVILNYDAAFLELDSLVLLFFTTLHSLFYSHLCTGWFGGQSTVYLGRMGDLGAP